MDTKKCTQCRVEKPLTEFHKQAKSPNGRRSRCRACCKIASAAHYRKNKKKLGIQTRQWQQDPRNRERMATIQRRSYLRNKYGLTEEAYDAMVIAQRGLCAVCKQPDLSKYGRLAVDHDHETGRVRKLLCSGCNTALGCAKDNPDLLRKLADYLESFNEEHDVQTSNHPDVVRRRRMASTR